MINQHGILRFKPDEYSLNKVEEAKPAVEGRKESPRKANAGTESARKRILKAKEKRERKHLKRLNVIATRVT